MFSFVVTPKNYLFLSKAMEDKPMEKFFKNFDEVNNKYNRIFIFITSIGGYTNFGLELANRIVNNPRLKSWACEENHSPELTHKGKKRLDWPRGTIPV